MWQVTGVQRIAPASDLGGFIAVLCFSLLLTHLYFLLHDWGGWFCPAREVIWV